MSERLSWTFSVQAVGGPRIATSKDLDVDAYDKIGVVVAAGADETVELQPGPAGRVQFLLVASTVYDDALTYKVNDPAGTAIKLDGQLLLLGDGAVGLLGAPPGKLIFHNGAADDATIQILIGRKATS